MNCLGALVGEQDAEMSRQTREDRESTFDGDRLVDDVVARLRNAARMGAQQKIDVERAVRRMIELKLQAVGAGEPELKQIRIEFAALRSTLTTIGEAVGAKSWGTIESIIGRAIARGMELVF